MQWEYWNNNHTCIIGGSLESLYCCFWLLLQNFERWWGPMNHSLVNLWMQVQCWRYHEVVGTLKHYCMLENLFELITLKGNDYEKALGTNACVHCYRLHLHVLAILWNFHYLIFCLNLPPVAFSSMPQLNSILPTVRSNKVFLGQAYIIHPHFIMNNF